MSNAMNRNKPGPIEDQGLGIDYTSISKLLLLPDCFDISSETALAKKVIESQSVFRKLFQLELAIQPILKSIEKTGLTISNEWFTTGLTPQELELSQAVRELNAIIGGSSEKLDKTLLKRYWEMNGMVFAFSQESLAKYRKLHRSYELLHYIMKLEAHLKKWGANLKLMGTQEPDGVLIHGKWRSFSSYTGRITAKEFSLTSMPKRMRDYVVSPSGQIILSLDLNSAELRFLSYFSECTLLLEAFEAGQDIYMGIADLIVDTISHNRNNNTDVARELAKKFVFSLLYGAGINTIARNLKKIYSDLSTSEVAKISEKISETYPELNQFLLSQAKNDALMTAYGDIVPIAQFNENQKRNYSLQASVAVLIKLLMVEIAKQYEVILAVHDEIWLLAPCREPTAKIKTDITNWVDKILDNLFPGFPKKNILSFKEIGGENIEKRN